MNSNIWAKTTLSAYPYLVKIAESIDRMVETRALSSFYVTSSNFSTSNIYDIANKIIDLSERKVVLINLKVLVEDILKKSDRIGAKLLIMKYFVKKKSHEICELMDMNLRTYFRKVKKAEITFEKILKDRGFTSERLCAMLKEETWIIELRDKYANIDNEEQVYEQEVEKIAI